MKMASTWWQQYWGSEDSAQARFNQDKGGNFEIADSNEIPEEALEFTGMKYRSAIIEWLEGRMGAGAIGVEYEPGQWIVIDNE